jgi:hypothetical protein
MQQMAVEDVFLPFAIPRERVPVSTHIRSTWVGSSLQAVRERGLLDRYLALLPEEHRAPILDTVAGVWLPMEVGVAHYRACDGLGLSKRETWDIGVHVTRKVHGTTLGLAVRLAKQGGVSPWTVLAQLQRLWDRIYLGGGVAVYRKGPKEAIVDIAGWPLAPIGYVRQTMPAVAQGVVEMFCQKAYISEVSAPAQRNSFGLKLQWV